MKKTQRGFHVFAEAIPLKSGTLRVQESSLALEGPHCWLFLDGMGEQKHAPQLGLDSARSLIESLTSFVDMAEAGALMEQP